jgi:prefoldin subunit 5
MQFQFTEVANIQQQIEALTAQLQQLTASVAPYTECQKEANWLVEKTAEHRQSMTEKGLTEDSLRYWAIALFKAAGGEELSIDVEFIQLQKELDEVQKELDEVRAALSVEAIAHKKRIDEVEALRSENKSLILDYQELNKKLDFFKSEIRENDSLSAEILKLRKENEDYQQRYDGIKAQKEQIEHDFFAVRADRDAKVQELKNKTTVPSADLFPTLDAHIEAIKEKKGIDDATSDLEFLPDVKLVEKSFSIDDIVAVPTGGLGTITHIEEGNAVIGQLINGESQYRTYALADLILVSNFPAETPPVETVPELTPNKYEAFLAAITKKYAWENLKWEEIKALTDCQAEGFKELSLAKATKAQKEKRTILLSANGRCSDLLVQYIQRTGDRSDLAWIPKTLKETVEEALAERSATPTTGLIPGEEIEVDGETMTVINHDTESDWVDVQTLTEVRTSVHISEVVSLSQQAA